jgi:hypothetical protein
MNAIRWTILVAAIEIVATGLFLIIAPSLFGWLIFGAELSEAGQALGRLGGIAMVGFGLAAGSAPTVSQPASVVRALAIYSILAAIYLGYVGLAGKLVGLLLWPAVALHAIFPVLLGRAWQRGKGSGIATII